MKNKSNYEGKLNKCVDAEKPAGSRVLRSKPRARLVFPVTTGVTAKKELRIKYNRTKNTETNP